MGSGKSTIGNTLAVKLKLPFIDLDQLLEKQENMSVQQLFQTRGELYFRKAERKALAHLIDLSSPAVIALGGGTPCYFDNMERLILSKHYSVYLKAAIPTLAKHLKKEKQSRPLISHIDKDQDLNEFIAKHLFERSFFYQQAKIIQSIDGLSIDEIVSKLSASLT